MSIVLLLGSGPNVVACRDWLRDDFDHIVSINNAWAVRPDWDFLIHPDDFPPDRQPSTIQTHQMVVTSKDYVPAQNDFGGFVYAGGTMAFTAAYWALHALRPTVIACLGCDMVYPKDEQTHFYGKGEPDPLRVDVTLRSLEAKSARVMALAARQGCAMVNLSRDESRLVYPRSSPDRLRDMTPGTQLADAVDAALTAEADAGYMVPSGKYWKEEDRFDTDVIDRIDRLWLSTVP
ncbi:hypothetical protein [Flavimaricola marinus]|uniref:Uncharacterized protein n=1 Tax=Flavimaricola marinus TaxID=1819565 RepID=A0A238L962_9RHOB|nr:hypothetical protein [Flavimaricola marinus]SMY06208.1 hypothetical protein LOM8899_00330 [Flavimaricola marinus]